MVCTLPPDVAYSPAVVIFPFELQCIWFCSLI